MAITVAGTLQNTLLSSFFNSARKVRARGFYIDTTGSNANLPGYGRNSIDLDMGINLLQNNSYEAERNEVSALQDYILIRIDDVDGYNTFRVDTLEFMNEAETVVYYEYDFSPAITFSNNGELYLEAVTFTVTGN